MLPDRAQVTMTTHFLRSYSRLVIKTCHRREVHAMGGMAAQIPIKNDPAANDAAMARVRADKEREASDGHDGTWVAHPGLVPLARSVFDAAMPGRNQIAIKRQDIHVAAADLVRIPEGTKTAAGLRQNVAVGIGYIEAWLRGIGCVPLFHLMEDAATAEISRAQIWQWRRHGATLEDGRPVDSALIRQAVSDELARRRLGRGALRGRRRDVPGPGRAGPVRDLPDAARLPPRRRELNRPHSQANTATLVSPCCSMPWYFAVLPSGLHWASAAGCDCSAWSAGNSRVMDGASGTSVLPQPPSSDRPSAAMMRRMKDSPGGRPARPRSARVRYSA